jgi:sulfide:quinone oxidoreductase
LYERHHDNRPPSPDTSEALLAVFAERGISFAADRRIASLDGSRSVAVLDDGSDLPFDLLLGVPKHRAPDVLIGSGMTEDGYIPVSPQTLQTRFPGVYAIGDVATIGVPKAGVFAEGAARVVAASLVTTCGNHPPRSSPKSGSSAPADAPAGSTIPDPTIAAPWDLRKRLMAD